MDTSHPLLNPDRLAALASYESMDTPPEYEYDVLTELAAQICNFPVALISLMDEHRQWFKSNYGVPDMTECPPEISVCSTTVCANELLYVPDLTKDARFKELSSVTGEPYLRAYCGMQLINPEGYTLGTLCIMDFEPHDLTPQPSVRTFVAWRDRRCPCLNCAGSSYPVKRFSPRCMRQRRVLSKPMPGLKPS